MGTIIYFLISFIMLFLSWKKYEEDITDGSSSAFDHWIDVKEFWYVIGITVAWPIAIPSALLWKLLDKFYNKFIKKNENI